MYNSEIQFQQGMGLHVLHAPFFTKDLSLFNVITNPLHQNYIAIHIVKTSHIMQNKCMLTLHEMYYKSYTCSRKYNTSLIFPEVQHNL